MPYFDNIEFTFYTLSFLNRPPEDTLSLVSDSFPLRILCIQSTVCYTIAT